MAVSIRDLLRDIVEPQLQYQWGVVLPDVGGLDGIHVLAQEVNVPIGHVEFLPYHRTNTKRYDPGFADVDSMDVTFLENVNGRVMTYLESWKQIVADTSGYYGSPEEYKRDIEVQLLDAKGSAIGTRFLAEDMWPSRINSLSLGHGSEPLLISCTFSCDNVSVITARGGVQSTPRQVRSSARQVRSSADEAVSGFRSGANDALSAFRSGYGITLPQRGIRQQLNLDSLVERAASALTKGTNPATNRVINRLGSTRNIVGLARGLGL